MNHLRQCPRCGGGLTGTDANAYCPQCAGRLLLQLEPVGDEPNATQRLGEYELGCELGRGAMGAVYRARQPKLRREVAIKVILASRFAGETARKRFLAEAELAAQLDHPNIVPIYEVGETADGPFYAMKLIEGGTLQERIEAGDGGRMEPRSSARLVSQVARAVSHAHQRGVLHRDLKPGNILLDVQGEPHITDFGLARQLAAESSLTLSGSSIGTPAYMSPEQARGEKSVTTASDVWSLGAILYHLLAGRPPFPGDSAVEVLHNVVEREPTPLRRVGRSADSISADLEVICLKCLEKDPAGRYTSARALADDLDRWLNHEPIQARPGTVAARMVKWTHRHPLRASSLALVLLGSVLFLGLILLYDARLREQRDQLAATLLRQDWQKAEELFDRGRDAEGVAVLTRMLRNQPGNRAVGERLLSALAEGNFAVRVGALIQPGGHLGCTFAAFSQDGTRVITANEFGVGHWEARTGRQIAGPAARSPGTDGNADWALSPDGRTLLLNLPDFAPATVQVWDVPGARWLGEWTGVRSALPAVFSPDGHRVRLAGDREGEDRDVLLGRPAAPESPELCAHFASKKDWKNWRVGIPTETLTCSNLVSGRIWVEAARHAMVIRPFAFSADGKYLVTGAKDRTAQVWELTSAARGSVSLRHGSSPVRAVFSPDGTTILTMADSGGAILWDAATGRRKFDLRHGDLMFDANFSPDGRWLVTAGNDSCARVWDVQTGREQQPALRHEYDDVQSQDNIIYDSRFTHAGRRILTAAHGGKITSWDAASHRLVSERVERTNAWHYGTVNADGTRLVALAPRAAWLWDARTFAVLARLTTNQHWVSAAEFSPDGRWLFLGTGTDALLFEASSGRHVGTLSSDEGQVSSARFSPDGRWLATTSDGGVARVWDVASRRPVSARMVHGGKIFSARFSPDGARLVTASADHTARIWDARTGLPLGKPMVHPQEVILAMFSPDSLRVLSSCLDGVARLWEQPVVTDDALPWICDLAEAIAGFRYDATGSIQLVFNPALDRVSQLIEQLPPGDRCAQWGRWLLDRSAAKPVSPSAGAFAFPSESRP